MLLLTEGEIYTRLMEVWVYLKKCDWRKTDESASANFYKLKSLVCLASFSILNGHGLVTFTMESPKCTFDC